MAYMNKLKGNPMPKAKRKMEDEEFDIMAEELDEEEPAEGMEEEGMSPLEDIPDEDLIAEIKARGLISQLMEEEPEEEEEV